MGHYRSYDLWDTIPVLWDILIYGTLYRSSETYWIMGHTELSVLRDRDIFAVLIHTGLLGHACLQTYMSTGIHFSTKTYWSTGMHLSTKTYWSTGIHLSTKTYWSTGIHLSTKTYMSSGTEVFAEIYWSTGTCLSTNVCLEQFASNTPPLWFYLLFQSRPQDAPV